MALPLAGFAGRKAEELVEGDRGERSPNEDTVLDRQGGTYPGVLRALKRTELLFDVDSLLQVKSFPIHYVKGVRLSDAGRDKKALWTGDVQVFLWTRDGSVVQGKLAAVRQGKWEVRPAWKPDSSIEVDMGEIALVQTLGGRVQYLSQLTPVEVKEQTVLAPPQPYQMDRTCQGDAISIAGRRYPWGIGVHADSELTFDLERPLPGVPLRRGHRHAHGRARQRAVSGARRRQVALREPGGQRLGSARRGRSRASGGRRQAADAQGGAGRPARPGRRGQLGFGPSAPRWTSGGK